ncbi:hypothetical protein [Roseateles sp.]|uniref:hypothetical protein n=1 Tax=Roseateles sp. TaxID=1971397 RepID=UPI0039E7868B
MTPALRDELFERVQMLRIPPQPESAPPNWKDWYHFVLMHPASGWRALANVSLAGGGGRAELQCTLVIHVPGKAEDPPRVHGASRSVPWLPGMLRPRPLVIRGDEVELTLQEQVWRLRLQPAGLDIGLALEARPDSTAMLVTEGSSFGSGFIGWGLVPRLVAKGELWACGKGTSVTHDWFCYQDHNFGRFRWGEDFGWEWAVAHAASPDGPAVTVVVDLRTDRAHSRHGLPYVFVIVGRELRKVFLGPAVTLRWAWSERSVLPARLPGTMATLLADCPERAPVSLTVLAADERDSLRLQLSFDTHLQIVVPDERQPVHTRISEASGAAAITLRLDGHVQDARGQAYAEYTR